MQTKFAANTLGRAYGASRPLAAMWRHLARRCLESMADLGEWVPIKDAAAALGLSLDATRRRLRTKALRGQRRRTPQGWRWIVWLPDDPAGRAAIAGAAPDVAPGGGVAAEVAPGGGVAAEVAPGGGDAPGGATRPPDGTTGATGALVAVRRAEEMARYTAALLEPWRQRVEAQAEEIGRLKAELAAAQVTRQRPWWRFR